MKTLPVYPRRWLDAEDVSDPPRLFLCEQAMPDEPIVWTDMGPIEDAADAIPPDLHIQYLGIVSAQMRREARAINQFSRQLRRAFAG